LNFNAFFLGLIKISKNGTSQDLEILEFQDGSSFATVTFVAHLLQDKKDVSFTEKSYFEKVKGKWLYHSGQVSQGYTRPLA